MIKKIIITGMNCGHCVERVRGLFEENNDIKNIDISLEQSCIVLDSTLKNEEIINILGDKYQVIEIA